MAKRERICELCHSVGITVTFPNGNARKKHIKQRHPLQTRETYHERRSQLRQYRKKVLLSQMKLFGNHT